MHSTMRSRGPRPRRLFRQRVHESEKQRWTRNLKRAHLNAVETVAAKEVQSIGAAQVQYLSQFGRYAANLIDLDSPAGFDEGPQAAHLIQAGLAAGEKNGYLFSMSATPSGFSVNAVPKVFGQTGRRTFYLDQEGVLHQNWGKEPASSSSPEF